VHMNQRCSLFAAVLLCVSTSWLSFSAAAADFPNKPITIVVGYSAGGGVDQMARILAEKLPAGLGQPVVVENKPGVGSIIGASYVAKAKPDGYTLLMGVPGPMVFNHVLNAKLPYGPNDFAPIAIFGDAPLMLLVNASDPVKTVPELVAYSKQNPDKSNYAASSSAFQLMNELFKGKTGARLTHIPYKSVTEGISSLIAGDVTMVIADVGPATTFLQGGRVKALAVTSGERLKEHPGIPTLSELGVDMKVSLWYGLLAPAGTPIAIVNRLNEEVGRVIALPEVQKRLAAMSVIPLTSTPEEFAKLIASEIPLWKKVAEDNNIKPN
jgi:tripartite-type tricarboxylate transporter receptor subunit TctC